jgi:hypothetical protein
MSGHRNQGLMWRRGRMMRRRGRRGRRSEWGVTVRKKRRSEWMEVAVEGLKVTLV